MLQHIHATLLSLLPNSLDPVTPPPPFSRPLFYTLASQLSPTTPSTARALYDLLLPYEPLDLLMLRPILSSKGPLLAICNTFESFQTFFQAEQPDPLIAADLLALLLKRLLLTRAEALLTTHSCHPHHVLALLRLLSGSEISLRERDLLPLSLPLLQILFFDDLQSQKMHYFSKLSARHHTFIIKFNVLESALNAIQGNARARLQHLIAFPSKSLSNFVDSYHTILPIIYQGLTTAAGPSFIWKTQSPRELAESLAGFLSLYPQASLRNLIENTENLEHAEDYLRWLAVMTLEKYRARYSHTHSLAFNSLLHSLQNPKLSPSPEAQALVLTIFHSRSCLWRLQDLHEFPSALPPLSFSQWEQTLLSFFHPSLHLQTDSSTLALARSPTRESLSALLSSVAPLDQAESLIIEDMNILSSPDPSPSSVPSAQWQGVAQWQGSYPVPRYHEIQEESESDRPEDLHNSSLPSQSLQVFIDERRWLSSDRRRGSSDAAPYFFRARLALFLDFDKNHWLATASALWQALGSHNASAMIALLKKSTSALVLSDFSQLLRPLELSLRQAANALRDKLIDHCEVQQHIGSHSSFLLKLSTQIAQDNAFQSSPLLPQLHLIYKTWQETALRDSHSADETSDSQRPHPQKSLPVALQSEDDFIHLMTNPSWLSFVIQNHHGPFMHKLCALYCLESSLHALMQAVTDLYPSCPDLLWPWILETTNLNDTSLSSAVFERYPIEFLNHCLAHNNSALALSTLRINSAVFTRSSDCPITQRWILSCADSYLSAPELGLGSLLLAALQYTLFTRPSYTQAIETKELAEKFGALYLSQGSALGSDLLLQLKTLLQRLTPKAPSDPSRSRRKSFLIEPPNGSGVAPRAGVSYRISGYI